MNYTFVTGVHGNERIPILALASMGINQTIANPRALAYNKRYIDHDLNMSFGVKGSGYEYKRAAQLSNELPKNDVIIDLHTFSTNSEPFAIVVEEKMIEVACQLGINHVVYMEYNIKQGHALIDHRNGVSVEVGNHSDPKSFDNTIRMVKNLQSKKFRSKVFFYKVIGLIDKPGAYVNFELHEKGYFPVLAGENAYDFYGLKAIRYSPLI